MIRGWESRVRTLLLVLCLCATAAFGQNEAKPTFTNGLERATFTALISGDPIRFFDNSGTITDRFEISPLNAPATLTVTIAGCMRGGPTCSATLATSSGTGNQTLTVTGPYDYYNVVASWTVPSNANGVLINRTATLTAGAGAAASNVGITGPLDGSGWVNIDCKTGCAGGNANGQATMANSAPVTIASDQSALTFKQSSTTDPAPGTANITAQDIASTSTTMSNSQVYVTGAATAGSVATFALGSGYESIRVLVTGTWTGTLTTEFSMDNGTTWLAQGLHQTGTPYTVSSFTGNFSAVGGAPAFTNFRVRSTASWTGTATVKIITTVNPSMLYIGNPLTIQDPTTPANRVAVKAASTAAGASDPALVASLSPNSPLPAGSNALGTVTVVQPTGANLQVNVANNQTSQAGALTNASSASCTGAGVGSNGVTVPTAGASTVAINVTGSNTATISFYYSIDGSNYQVVPSNMVFPIAGGASVTGFSANGQWIAFSGGTSDFMVCGPAGAAQTATINLQASLSEHFVDVVNTPSVAQSGTWNVGQTGTWTVQPGNTANTTAWLVTGTGGTFPVTGTFWQATQPISGTVAATQSGTWTDRVTGNAGASFDAAQNAAAPANNVSSGGTYNSALPTITTGNDSAIQLDVNGQVRTSSDMAGTVAGTAPNSTDVVGCIFTAAGVGPSNAQGVPCQVDSNGGILVHNMPNLGALVAPTNSVQTALTTAVVVKASQGNLYGVIVTNGSTTTACYLEFMNIGTSPTLGTGATYSIPIPVSSATVPGQVIIPPGALPLSNFSTGISVGLATTYNGSTACATAGTAVLMFK